MIQNKYVIKLSFIVLFLNIIANMIWYRYFMIEEMILKQVSAENSRLAEMYKKNILDIHSSVVNKLRTTSYKDLLQNEDFIKFANDSVAFFANTSSNISLFNMQGDKYISSNNNKILNLEYYIEENLCGCILEKIGDYFWPPIISERSLAEDLNIRIRNSISLLDIIIMRIDRYVLSDIISYKSALKDAFEGKTNHGIVLKAFLINDKEFQSEKVTFITSYIPVIDSRSGNFLIEGVIEINTEVTNQWASISYLEQRVFIAFIIIYSIFFAIVAYNTNYAQAVINKQFKTNRDLKEAKILAESENLAKTQFLANISHELRTPLNTIIGFSEIIISGDDNKVNNEQYKDYINDINNAGKHLLGIINDILDFSKASADKLKVDNIELDLNKLITSSIRFVQPRAEKARIKLIEDLPKTHIIIKADPQRLKQVMLNLLSNSVKFTIEGGCITVLVRADEIQKCVNIKVIDTGIGMKENDIPKALSVFGQIDNKLSKKYEGTGLGLPLTKKLVELMQGTFDLQSTVGVGTIITLTFKYEISI